MRYILIAFMILFVGLVIVLVSDGIKCKSVTKSDAVVDDYVMNENYTDVQGVGKGLFISKCASCHSVTVKIVGPALKDIIERGPWEDSLILYQYIKDPSSLKNSEYVKALQSSYEVRHIGFSELSNLEIKAILDYIKVKSSKKNIF